MAQNNFNDAALPARSWSAYQPLIATAFVAAITAHILKIVYGVPFLPVLTGLWLVQFSLVKLFDLQNFASSFGVYDLLATKIYAYAFIFPFLQLALGLAYLAHFTLDVVSVMLIALGVMNLIGIFRRTKQEAAFTNRYFVHKTPLRDAAIIENALMIFMGLGYYLVHSFFWGPAIPAETTMM